MAFICQTVCSVHWHVLIPLMHAQLPGDIKLNYFDKESNMQEISIEELTKGKKASPLCLRSPNVID